MKHIDCHANKSYRATMLNRTSLFLVVMMICSCSPEQSIPSPKVTEARCGGPAISDDSGASSANNERAGCDMEARINLSNEDRLRLEARSRAGDVKAMDELFGYYLATEKKADALRLKHTLIAAGDASTVVREATDLSMLADDFEDTNSRKLHILDEAVLYYEWSHRIDPEYDDNGYGDRLKNERDRVAKFQKLNNIRP